MMENPFIHLLLPMTSEVSRQLAKDAKNLLSHGLTFNPLQIWVRALVNSERKTRNKQCSLVWHWVPSLPATGFPADLRQVAQIQLIKLLACHDCHPPLLHEGCEQHFRIRSFRVSRSQGGHIQCQGGVDFQR